MKQNRKMTRVHTRKLDRMVAKNNIIRTDHQDKKRSGDKTTHGYLHHFIKSGMFAKHWREYA